MWNRLMMEEWGKYKDDIGKDWMISAERRTVQLIEVTIEKNSEIESQEWSKKQLVRWRILHALY